MAKVNRQELVAAVRAHAEEHYADDEGWDEIVECFSDSDIDEEIPPRTRTANGAIKAVGKLVELRHSVYKDIVATADDIEEPAPKPEAGSLAELEEWFDVVNEAHSHGQTSQAHVDEVRQAIEAHPDYRVSYNPFGRGCYLPDPADHFADEIPF